MSYQRVLNHLSAKDRKKIENSPELQELIRDSERTFDRVNKRIRNIEKNGSIISPAYNALKSKRGDAPRFGTSGTYTDLNSYLKEAARAQNFNNLETSSVKGAQRFTRNLKKQIKRDTGQNIDNKTIAKIFDVLHAVHERMPEIIFSNQLRYEDYIESVVSVSEDTDFSKIDSKEDLETVILNTINKLTSEISENENNSMDAIERMTRGTGKLY